MLRKWLGKKSKEEKEEKEKEKNVQKDEEDEVMEDKKETKEEGTKQEKEQKEEVKKEEKQEVKKEGKEGKEEKETTTTETKKTNKKPVLGGTSPCGHSYSQYPQHFIDSNVPCLFGIDEAGRGPVLGPMVYACAFWPLNLEKELKQMNFDDSKALKEEVRENLFNLVVQNGVGYHVKSLSPQYISHSMLRLAKYNLNEISHDTATDLIQDVLDSGVNVTHVYVDTVGDSGFYERKLSSRFPALTIKVSKKADSLYPIVSAASICAKVIRDGEIKKWRFEEKPFHSLPSLSSSLPSLPSSSSSLSSSSSTPDLLDLQHKQKLAIGSGYPADPVTKKWLKNNCDFVFGFPNIVRFSWKTVSNLLKTDGACVKWGDEEEEENGRPYKRLKRSQSEGGLGTAKKGKKFQDLTGFASTMSVQKMFSSIDTNQGGGSLGRSLGGSIEGGLGGGRKRKRGRDR
eukprot:CAMPEP_0201512832 /NCGR_PEP_ID=MMETSP0161_2-20130828/5008_1 /ASSEMBLY_ACC=CAM_ASM_000251 /TAXON_ID=180227 /ORGANISM="Neoparamoeba aestuarina, Strain SoJaBio B1-5/56/2" /LENGTH=455 /DNA_ID=CAMNT_0047908819 /DNA_START=50 /DNA_END=1413 /DNA_ORIENTATION=+